MNNTQNTCATARACPLLSFLYLLPPLPLGDATRRPYHISSVACGSIPTSPQPCSAVRLACTPSVACVLLCVGLVLFPLRYISLPYLPQASAILSNNDPTKETKNKHTTIHSLLRVDAFTIGQPFSVTLPQHGNGFPWHEDLFSRQQPVRRSLTMLAFSEISNFAAAYFLSSFQHFFFDCPLFSH